MLYRKCVHISIFLTLVCGLVVACTGTGRNYADTSVQETLEVEILPNASKMFVYRLRWPQDQHQTGIHMGRERESGGVNVNGYTEKRLQENAAFQVQKMGYCREGFLVIDSSVSRFHLWLKGECKEGASEVDKKTFNGKQVLPVKGVN